MSTQRNIATGDRDSIGRRHPTFFFDFSAVFSRCKSLKRQPERVALMCQARVRSIAPGELMIPDKKGFYLVVRTRRGAAAEALVGEVKLALRQHLFGAKLPADKISTFRTVPPSDIVELEDRPAPSRARDEAHRQPEPSGPPPSPTIFFNNADFKPGLVPLFNLRCPAPPIHLCGAVASKGGNRLFGPEALRFCHPQYRPSVDLAVLAFSLRIPPVRTPTRSAIAASVSYETLAWSRSRQIYLNMLKAADLSNNSSIIIKIDHVPAGTPASRLADMVAALKPLVPRIFVQLPDGGGTLMRSNCIGLSGICGTIPPGTAAAELAQFARQLERTALAQHTLACALGAEGIDAFRILHNEGIGHASPRPDRDSILLESQPCETAQTLRKCAS